MGPELEKAIQELSLRMRMIKAHQEDEETPKGFTDRDLLLLQLLGEHGKMNVSEVAQAYPDVSESTISTNLTKLWRKGLLTKNISPANQRVTMIELTEKGKKELGLAQKQRAERFNALFHAIQVTSEEKQILIRICMRAVKYLDEHLRAGVGRNTETIGK